LADPQRALPLLWLDVQRLLETDIRNVWMGVDLMGHPSEAVEAAVPHPSQFAPLVAT
jgi:hypothetical protein